MRIKPLIKPDKQVPNKGFEDGKFKPGQSGNPKGRPPIGKCIPDLLRRFGATDCPEQFVKKIQTLFPNIKELTVIEAVILRTYVEALQGSSWAVEFIAERTEGKVTQPQSITLPSSFDLSRLTTEELLLFKTLRGKIEVKSSDV